VVADIKVAGTTETNAYFPMNLAPDFYETLVMDVDGVAMGSTVINGQYPRQYQPVSKNDNVKFNEAVFNELTWSSSRNSVATVDEKSGIITAVGPGLATVTVKSNDDKITDSIEVMVLPRYYNDSAKTQQITSSATSPHVFPLSLDQDATIFSRAASAKHYLDYDIKTVNDDKKTDYVDIVPNEATGDLLLKGTSRAGKYVLDTYLKNNTLSARASWNNQYILLNSGYPNKLFFNIPLYVKNAMAGESGKVHMSVNDTYNLYDNSNVQKIDHFTISYDKEKYKNYLTYDTTTGEFTALKEGSIPVTISLNSTYASLYPSTYTTFSFTIEIADSLKLNMSETSIPVGSSVLQLWITNDVSDTVTWSSSNESYVKVDSNGNLTGVAQGSAVVTASVIVDGVVKKASCLVYVYSSVSSITISPSELSVFVNDTSTVKAVFQPTSATNVTIKWISLDPTIATVESQTNKVATVTGKKSGETLIMAVSTNNIVLGTCKVTVKEVIDSIKLSDTNLEVPLSQGTHKITATVTPSTASVKDIVWSSSNPGVATVDNGVLTLVSAGETIIAASAPGTKAATQYCSVKVTQSVNGLVLASTEKIVYMGETSTIGYSVLPTTAGNKGVTWTSTKPSVATVNSSSGLITPVSVGETTIIAKTVEGGFTKYCTVYVKSAAKGIKITLHDVVIQKDEEYQIPYTLDPSSATEADIAWTSTNTSVATVSKKGVVKGVTQGSTIIMAKLANGEIAYCNVVVQEEVEGLQLNYDTKTVYTGKTFKLKASIKPEGATNPEVTYESSNPAVATVTAKGTVKGIKSGTAIITVTTKENGFKAFCIVTVIKNVTSIKLNYTNYKLGVKKSFYLKGKVTSTATNKSLKWTSSNPSVATVSSTGKVTGKKYGVAYITATAKDGSGVKATCKVQVVRLVTSLKLNKKSITMVAGRQYTLKATIKPSSSTYRTAYWSSSDVSIATVDTSGTIYALQPGIVYITAKAKDSSGKKAICRVEVKAAVSSTNIYIMTDNIVLAVNQTKVMSKSVTPATSTDTVYWVSDNEGIATVNKYTGKVTGKYPGVCTITAYTTSGRTDTATVTVMGLSRTSMTIEQYSRQTLYVEGVTSGVTWESLNPLIAEVDSSGNVTGRRPGSTVIVATYRGAKLRCGVIVTKIN
jgi:uncharacterized protein YjdB